jgi:hypothetical protein
MSRDARSVIRSSSVALLRVFVLATFLTACSPGDDGSDADAPSSISSASPRTSGSAGSSTPSIDGDGSPDAPPFPANAAPDTGGASQDSFVTGTEIRTGLHDGYDRVVFEVEGTGTPGWDVRYVAEAASQGSGEDLPVEGGAILQVTISGVGYPTETGIEEYAGSVPLSSQGTEVVTEVVWDSTFEGTSVAFVGATEQTPFRVYLIENPTRVVLDVVHPG